MVAPAAEHQIWNDLWKKLLNFASSTGNRPTINIAYRHLILCWTIQDMFEIAVAGSSWLWQLVEPVDLKSGISIVTWNQKIRRKFYPMNLNSSTVNTQYRLWIGKHCATRREIENVKWPIFSSLKWLIPWESYWCLTFPLEFDSVQL